jgi:deubiquitinase DESI2
MAPRKSSSKSVRSHRSTLSLQKTEVVIHVYDLLPVRVLSSTTNPPPTPLPRTCPAILTSIQPGRFSSILWAIGTSLLHSGVVINGREYAYGGHDKRGVTGVYWTKPKTLPPGGTFKHEILQGFTLSPQNEIDAIIHEVSQEFQGTSYNLLTKNCNHFTAHLCQRLTGRPGPGWLNRAASIGVALPCIVPRDWIEPPEYDTAEGELLDENSDERSRMLRTSSERPRLVDLRGKDNDAAALHLDEGSSEDENREEERRSRQKNQKPQQQR